MAFPNAELVDGGARHARGTADQDRRGGRRAPCLRFGSPRTPSPQRLPSCARAVSEQTLTGVLLEAEAAGGVSTPATQDAAWVTSTEHPWRRAAATGVWPPATWWRFGAGVLAGGYVGEVGRTWPVGDNDEGRRRASCTGARNELWDRLIDACRPGAPASDLLDAYEAAGEPLPPMPVAHGLGLGFDHPVVTPHLPATAAARDASTPAWCWPSPATCGRRASAPCSGAMRSSSPTTEPRS